MKSLLTCLCAALLTALSAAGHTAGLAACSDTDPEAIAWLEKMVSSANSNSYHGVVTLQRGDEVQSMALSHSVTEHGVTENMTRLSGQGARVERRDHPLHCIHPGHKLQHVGEEMAAGRCGIAEHYRFTTTADGERVAGRSAVRVRVQPRDIYRYGYVMELDSETGLLLKARMIGRGNKVLERFQFVGLKYTAAEPVESDTDVVHQAAHPHPGVNMQDTSGGRSWTIGWVPGGFTPTDAATAGARRTFTDGLAVFSVFVEELTISPGEGVVRSGGTTSYTRGMSLAGESVLVTVIGEVPVNTARMVAASLAWAKPNVE